MLALGWMAPAGAFTQAPMLDAQGKVWVIDFDKCDIRSPGPWQQQMLDRLLRSLRKELICNVPFYWQESDWPALLAGYQAD